MSLAKVYVPDGSYQISLPAREFALTLTLSPTQPVLLQGEAGFSRKGPRPGQASYYITEPHLQVQGQLQRAGRSVAVAGTAWMDHEWSTSVLDPQATGWDWVGANLDDGSALMAFQIRAKNGATVWRHATLRDAAGHVTQYSGDKIRFTPQRHWRSPRTGARYPVAMAIDTRIKLMHQPRKNPAAIASVASSAPSPASSIRICLRVTPT